MLPGRLSLCYLAMRCSQGGGEDPLYYGITDTLVEQVSCMTYNTFRCVATRQHTGGMLDQ